MVMCRPYGLFKARHCGGCVTCSPGASAVLLPVSPMQRLATSIERCRASSAALVNISITCTLLVAICHIQHSLGRLKKFVIFHPEMSLFCDLCCGYSCCVITQNPHLRGDSRHLLRATSTAFTTLWRRTDLIFFLPGQLDCGSLSSGNVASHILNLSTRHCAWHVLASNKCFHE